MPIEMNKFKGDGDLLALNVLGASAEQASFVMSAVTSVGGSVLNGEYWTFGTDRNEYYVWYNVLGAAAGPTDPAVFGAVGIPVTLSSAVAINGSEVMEATKDQLSKLSEITVAVATSAITVTNKEFGAVTAPVAVTGLPFAVDTIVTGVARVTIAAKHVIYASGLVEAIIGEDLVVYDVAGSTYRVEDINKGFGGSRVGIGAVIAGNANDTPEKADNLVMSIGGSGALPAFAEGSTISGVS